MTTEPAWLAYARTQLGVREVAGAGNSATILGWAKKLGAKVLGVVYNADSTPWCGLFVAQCMAQAGVTAPPIAVRASSWDGWGFAYHPTLGCVLRFAREGGGHVGLYVGEDDTCYHILGGNQGDAVTITRIEKSRMVASRWPLGFPVNTTPVKMTASGVVSRNEA